MPFVVKGSANAVYAMIIVVKTVTVFQDYIVLVKLILHNVMVLLAAGTTAPLSTHHNMVQTTDAGLCG